MKNIIRILMVLGISLSMWGCKKSLDIPYKGAYTFETYFNDDNTINQAVVATYATLLHNGLWAREYYFTFDLLGYEAKNDAPLQGDILQLAQYNFGPTQPQLTDMWASFYRMITRANLVIDRATIWEPTVDIEKNKKKQYIAEAKFLRAYAYFNLVSLYGRVPLRLTFSAGLDDNSYSSRAPVADIWAAIEKDLIESQPDLPLNYPAQELGRITRGAAVALLGKSYLYQKKWGDAQTELTKLTKSPYAYRLADNYLDLFSNTNENNPETIFQVMNQKWTDWGIGNMYYMFSGQESGGKASHTGRAQEYGFNDWSNVFITTSAVKAFTYSVNGSTFIDPRAKYTFYGDASSGGQTIYCQNCKDGPIPYPFNIKGYHFLKYQYYNEEATYGGPASGINGQVIRYADVLLMLAETYIQQGNTGTEPLALINQVRGRSSVQATPYTTLGGPNQAFDILKQERRIEFTGEQLRYFDLIRWGIAKQTINAERLVEDNTQPFQDKNILLPIPTSEKNSNPNIASDVQGDWN